MAAWRNLGREAARGAVPEAADAASLKPAPVRRLSRHSDPSCSRPGAGTSPRSRFAARPSRVGRSSDTELLKRVASKDPGALGSLYQRHARSVYLQTLSMVRDPDAAAEILQEVFLQVWLTADGYRPEKGTALTWLLAVTRHCAIDMVRRQAARARAQQRVSALAPTCESPDAFDHAWEAICQRHMTAGLQTLPAEQLRAVELAYFEGLTHRDIARRLDIPVGTVKGRLRLGLGRLRKGFDDHGMLAR